MSYNGWKPRDIQIIICGPVGSGKSQLAKHIREYAEESGWQVKNNEMSCNRYKSIGYSFSKILDRKANSPATMDIYESLAFPLDLAKNMLQEYRMYKIKTFLKKLAAVFTNRKEV
jgi:ABC-type Mn2+/Zn2+ transport system ATPase subunit